MVNQSVSGGTATSVCSTVSPFPSYCMSNSCTRPRSKGPKSRIEKIKVDTLKLIQRIGDKESQRNWHFTIISMYECSNSILKSVFYWPFMTLLGRSFTIGSTSHYRNVLSNGEVEEWINRWILSNYKTKQKLRHYPSFPTLRNRLITIFQKLRHTQNMETPGQSVCGQIRDWENLRLKDGHPLEGKHESRKRRHSKSICWITNLKNYSLSKKLCTLK